MAVMRRIAVLVGLTLAVASAAPAAVAAGPRATALGNQIQIVVPSVVRPRIVYDVTVVGSSGGPAIAYLFVDYAGCSRTLSAERHRSPHASYHYAVSGPFEKVSGWSSSSPGADHACAYLVARSGSLLARRRVTFTIG